MHPEDGSSITSNESMVRRRSQRSRKKPNRLRDSFSEDENEPEDEIEQEDDYSPNHRSNKNVS